MKKFNFLFLSFLLVTGIATANNILVTNATISGQNTASHFALVNFNVSWENSWRTSTNENNYDGAWIFVKFRKNGTTDWRHATLNISGNTAATGATITIPTDGKGGFIYRSANGIGNVSYTANSLRWNYGVDGILDNETVEIRVFALEMVYIPTGSYLLGSGGVESYGFTDGSTTNPYLVANNSAINFGTTAGLLNPNGNGPSSGSIPAAFPKGYNAFWLMKYECSQQQYVDFLNHLDLARATANQTQSNFTGTHPNLVAPQPERALGEIGFNRTAAIADWSGLRPMTELEYEKACRGYNTPAVPNEYAWGNTTIVPVSAVTNAGAANEAVSSPANANANINSGLGSTPTRVGIFARTTGSDRTLSGATYYGVMNMSDNVHEICFSIINAPGRLIDETVNGDGNLGADGRSDIITWQSYQAYGIRGGSIANTTSYARVSDRGQDNFFISFPGDGNYYYNGFRLARVAP